MTEQQSISIICTSVHHNNTRRLAETLADVLGAPIYSVEEAKALVDSKYDLLGIGSGIYFGRHHPSLLQLVESWPAHPCRVFIYSTAGIPLFRWFQHRALRKRLVRRDFKIIGEFCCRGWDSVGPLWLMGGINRKHPNAKDLERARAFALQLKDTIHKDR
jgi:flavodoxin